MSDLCLTEMMRVEMGRPAFEALQIQIEETVERETGRKHAWVLTPHDSIWRLKDLSELVGGWMGAARGPGGCYERD